MCGEFETMLNSCPGKGVVDTACAKMMMGSETFQQYLGLLKSEERASIEKVREKNRFRFGDNETWLSFWSAVIPMNIGGHLCREKVAIVAGDAPFSISKPFLQRVGAVLDLEQGQVTFNKLGVKLDLGESATGRNVIDLIPDSADRFPDDTARECAQFCEASSWPLEHQLKTQMLHVFRDFEKKFGVLCKLSMCHFHNLWRRFLKLSQVWPKKDVLRIFVKRGSSYRCFVFFCFEASRSFVVHVTSCFQPWLVQGLCTGRLQRLSVASVSFALHVSKPAVWDHRVRVTYQSSQKPQVQTRSFAQNRNMSNTHRKQ